MSGRDYDYAAGVWEQHGAGWRFVELSRHSTEALAVRAARRYAREQTTATGGRLSWSGGVRSPGCLRSVDSRGAVHGEGVQP